MGVHDQIDQALGDVRRLSWENKKDISVIKKFFQDKYGEDHTPALKQKNYIFIHNKKIMLNPLGEKRADNFLRRYYLAKKFANDILEVPYEELERFALEDGSWPWQAISISKPELLRVVRDCAPRGQKGKLAEELMKALDAAGAVNRRVSKVLTVQKEGSHE